MVWGTLGGLLTPLAIGSGHERALAPLPVLLVGAVGGAFAGVLIPLHFSLGMVKNCSNHLLTRGMASGDVEELLSGSWALTSQLMKQGLAGGSRQESSYNTALATLGSSLYYREKRQMYP